MSGLGRKVPSDFDHVDKYPLSAVEIPARVPVVLGINWYSNFDNPMTASGIPYTPGQRGMFWIGRGDLGSIRGGHAICAKPYEVGDGWWDFMNQGNEGSCVGFACARAITLLNRKKYAARWIYQQAQLIDEYPETPPEEGTSVRAGFEILRTRGAERWYDGHAVEPPELIEGISAYRWTTNWQDVRDVLGLPDSIDGVPFLNSWGRDYSHLTRIPDEVGQRLLDEDGEAGIPTDR